MTSLQNSHVTISRSGDQPGVLRTPGWGLVDGLLSHFDFFFFSFFCGAGMEPRVLCVLGKHSTNEFHQVQPFRIFLENVFILFCILIIFTAAFSH